VGILSGPAGIIVSKVMIMSCFSTEDERDENYLVAKANFELFMMINSLVVIAMVLPSLIFIRDKPPSPPR
jgi:hypothetical protein